MTKLFESSTINGMELANRFVRSATWEGMAADDGGCTPKLIDLMTALCQRRRWPDHQQSCLCQPGRSSRSLAIGSVQ